MATKKLVQLTILELKAELRERGIDQIGNKEVLLTRLRQALTSEGQNTSEITLCTAVQVAEKNSNGNQEAKPEIKMMNAAPNAGLAVAQAVEIKPPVSMVEDVEPAAAGSAHTALHEDEDDCILYMSSEPPQMQKAEGPDHAVEEADSKASASCSAVEKKDSSTASSNMASTYAGKDKTNVGDSQTKEGSTKVPKGDNMLWMSGLLQSCRAADLKTLCSKYGKVIGSKVVMSAKLPGSNCFGQITMSTVEEAARCIEKLDNTEFLGQKINVELDSKRRPIGSTPTATVPPVTKAPPALSPPPAAPVTLAGPVLSIWVSGLSSTMKATDLKAIFLDYGKVTGAKVVMSAKQPGSKCYGLVTLSSAAEADECIRRVNKKEVNGCILTVEKTKPDALSRTKPQQTESAQNPQCPTDSQSKASDKKDHKSGDHGRNDRSRDHNRPHGGKERESKEADKKGNKNDVVLSLEEIREQKRRQQILKRERELKEKDRMKATEVERERRLQKAEAEKLARQREILVMEKLKLDRERIEAERMRLELEQLRQRQELERQQILERERQAALLRLSRSSLAAGSGGSGAGSVGKFGGNEGKMESKRPNLNDSSYWAGSGGGPTQAKRAMMADVMPTMSDSYEYAPDQNQSTFGSPMSTARGGSLFNSSSGGGSDGSSHSRNWQQEQQLKQKSVGGGGFSRGQGLTQWGGETNLPSRGGSDGAFGTSQAKGAMLQDRNSMDISPTFQQISNAKAGRDGGGDTWQTPPSMAQTGMRGTGMSRGGGYGQASQSSEFSGRPTQSYQGIQHQSVSVAQPGITNRSFHSSSVGNVRAQMGVARGGGRSGGGGTMGVPRALMDVCSQQSSSSYDMYGNASESQSYNMYSTAGGAGVSSSNTGMYSQMQQQGGRSNGPRNPQPSNVNFGYDKNTVNYGQMGGSSGSFNW